MGAFSGRGEPVLWSAAQRPGADCVRGTAPGHTAPPRRRRAAPAAHSQMSAAMVRSARPPPAGVVGTGITVIAHGQAAATRRIYHWKAAASDGMVVQWTHH